jgi:chemotaxis protein histidine kinase CheA
MSNILFYFGATILSLILIMTSATPTYYHDKIQNATLPYYHLDIPTTTIFTNVFAQEDEEEDKEEEEKEDSKDKDKEEKDNEEQQEEEEKEDSKDKEEEEEKEEEQNETTTTTESQITQTELNELIANNIQQQLDQPILNLTNDHILNYTAAATTTTVQEEEQQPQLVEEVESNIVLQEPPTIPTIGKPFNATCNCFATNVPPTPTPTPPPPQPEPQIELIPVTSANIDNAQSNGQITDPAYTGFYTVSNLLDNKIDEYSFWSQAGQSSFYIELDNILDNYQVCSAELTVNKPKNIPYLLDIGVSKNYTGVIDQTTEKIPFDKCVKNMDEILMIFDSPQGSYISIGEMKLFGKKIVVEGGGGGGGSDSSPQPQQPQQPDPTIPQPQPAPYHQNNNATKINIENSTAEVDIKNSTITFKFDPQSAQATNYNVITIPNTEVVK